MMQIRMANLLSLVLLTVSLVACDTLKTRNDVAQEVPGRPGAPATTLPASPGTAPSAQAPVIPQPPTAPAAPPTFLNKELPKVGLILGPGGMKAYAHIGVLRELSRARIPVHAVAGLEWGALIGGLYAAQGQANDAEWKSFKLKESDLPNEGGFLSSRMRAQSISVLRGFLDTAFGSSTLDRSKIEFGCPAYWMRQQKFGWMTKGSSRDAMLACMPYPPFFTDNGGVYASPFSVDEAAAFLRSKGANLIVLVNVLGKGDLVPSRLAQDSPSDQLIWNEIRQEMARAKSPVVHYTINVDTSGHPVTDFAARRDLMDQGAKSAADVVNKMVSQYGF